MIQDANSNINVARRMRWIAFPPLAFPFWLYERWQGKRKRVESSGRGDFGQSRRLATARFRRFLGPTTLSLKQGHNRW